jgi:mannose-6-phosphate isomerase-like protein (cupin superfamily)
MPVHELHGVRFTSLVSPSSGSVDISVWQTEVPAGAPAAPHQLTRQEVLVVLAGRAVAHIGGSPTPAGPGDVVLVPADTDFALENVGDEPLRVIACFPVGGKGVLDGEAVTLPWMT